MPRSVQSTTLPTLPMRQPIAQLPKAVSKFSLFARSMQLITDSMCVERKRSAVDDGIPDCSVKSDVVEAVMSNAEEDCCYMCQALDPEYESTNKIKGIKPVPVCSEDCETRYLEIESARKKVRRFSLYPVIMN